MESIQYELCTFNKTENVSAIKKNFKNKMYYGNSLVQNCCEMKIIKIFILGPIYVEAKNNFIQNENYDKKCLYTTKCRAVSFYIILYEEYEHRFAYAFIVN